MIFKRAKEIFAERLKRAGIENVKYLRKPGRGDLFNRLAYLVATGRFKVVGKEEFGEILPGRILDSAGGVNLLFSTGSAIADAVILKSSGSFKGVSIISREDFSYPDIAVDMRFFPSLIDKEKRSLFNQLEIMFGVVKDYFTPENFYLIDREGYCVPYLKEFFTPDVPFEICSKPLKKRIVVLDPNADETLTRDDVDEDTVLVFGGIVDHGERLKGATAEIYRGAVHRKIAYRGSVLPVSDRINELTKLLCDFLTCTDSLEEVIRRNLTRQAKLRIARESVAANLKRIKDVNGVHKCLPLSFYNQLAEGFSLKDFHFRKASKHVNGFTVVKDEILDKIIKEEAVKGRKILQIEGLIDGYIVKKYP
ncbi:tRNA (guanine-N1)-methyltransferase [Desulfurobacterium sp.]|uniref:tRNA (guanine-N1)-methyltransferase n=1 Tax=Desulfurobacterium sp. TaxID=2004706 RepID=UPI00263319C4|nr:tRNA (guanine-N1)-methyltransferase [Desulfurobacterium sp.]